MSLLKRTSRAYIWSQVGRLAEAGLFFAFSLLLARALGPRAYGIYSLAISTAALLGFLTLIGLAPETFGRFVPEVASTSGPTAVRNLLKKLLLVRSVTVTAMIVVAGAFSLSSFGHSRLNFLEGTFACVLFVFVVRAFYDLLANYPGALLELRQVAVAKILAGLITPLLFLAFLLLQHASPSYALFATGVGYFIAAVWLLVPWFRSHPDSPPSCGKEVALSRILKFGLFVWMVNFFIVILSDNADVLLVGWLLGDPALVGYYAVGARLVFRMMTLLLGWVQLIAIGSLNQAFLEGGPEKMALAMNAQWKLCMVSLTGPLAALYCFADPIVRVFFSADYLPSIHIVRILASLMICSAACGFVLHSGILYVLNRERLACSIMGGAACFNVVLEIFLVRKMGIDGAAWATGISYLLLSVTTAVVGAMLVPVRTPWLFNLKLLAAAAVAIVATHWLSPDSIWQLLAAFSVWATVFVAALAVLKPLAPADSLHLRKISPRFGSLAQMLFAPKAAVIQEGHVTW